MVPSPRFFAKPSVNGLVDEVQLLASIVVRADM